MSHKGKTADVIVIGGGVIGCSIAYHLAKQKVSVLLIEKEGLASGSSGACDGFVTLQSKKPGIHLELASASLWLYPALTEDLPLDIEFEQHGCLVVIEGRRELKVMQDFVEKQSSAGVELELLDGKQARDLEPVLAPDIMGATFNPKAAQVNPIKLTLGLARGAIQYGARIITGQEVVGLVRESGKVEGVRTKATEYQAGAVVNACGVLAPGIGRMCGLELPIKPRRGQLLVTEAVEPQLTRALLSSRYIAAKFDPEIAAQSGGGCAIEQTASGNFLLGSTREFAGYDRRTSLRGLKTIADRTSRIIPRLREFKAIRSFAGLRPYTPDGLPILGKVPGVDGLYMAAGHEGDGIALAPVTGRLMSQLIVRGETEFSLEAFGLERFGAGEGGSGS